MSNALQRSTWLVQLAGLARGTDRSSGHDFTELHTIPVPFFDDPKFVSLVWFCDFEHSRLKRSALLTTLELVFDLIWRLFLVFWHHDQAVATYFGRIG